jgi:hypothetical protein
MISTFNHIARRLEATNPRLEGWCELDKAFALAATTFALRPLVSVEIGCWAGRSVLPVALSLQEIGRGIIHCIEPWSPQASAEQYTGVNHDWWLNVANHDYAKNQFFGWVKDTQCQLFVRVHQTRSDDVTPPDDIGLLHIDGVHTTQARKDVSRFGPKVSVGGIVFMDDIGWQNDGIRHVRLAADDLMAMGFKFLYGIYSKGNECEVFQRVK